MSSLTVLILTRTSSVSCQTMSCISQATRWEQCFWTDLSSHWNKWTKCSSIHWIRRLVRSCTIMYLRPIISTSDAKWVVVTTLMDSLTLGSKKMKVQYLISLAHKKLVSSTSTISKRMLISRLRLSKWWSRLCQWLIKCSSLSQSLWMI